MRVKFQECLDIFLFLTPEEAEKLKRNWGGTPVLSAKSEDDINFYLMNPEFRGKPSDTVEVKVPQQPSGNYWVRIGDDAYDKLTREKEFVTRYDGGHKIGLVIEDTLERIPVSPVLSFNPA